jgi:cytochrome d ubiquinol oxidase subunit II
VFALALFAYLAAVYLALGAGDGVLREDFRRRALVSCVVSAIVALAVRGLAVSGAPRMEIGLRAPLWAIPLQLSTGLAAVTAFAALWMRRWQLARFAAAAEVSLVLWGWALAEYPYIVPHTLTIRAAAAPRSTLEVLLLTLAIGAALLFPSLIYLMRTFTGERAYRG